MRNKRPETPAPQAARDHGETKRPAYQAPQVLAVFELEAMAVVCTDTNAKNEVALGCNPAALFS